jgi:hypothetical protein
MLKQLIQLIAPPVTDLPVFLSNVVYFISREVVSIYRDEIGAESLKTQAIKVSEDVENRS